MKFQKENQTKHKQLITFGVSLIFFSIRPYP